MKAQVLTNNPADLRIGYGVDIHQLVNDRPLFVGGVLIKSEKGALGHSDADVLIHAICDAILGAAALGDIGTHFPDNHPEFLGIDSKILLKRSFDKVKKAGYLLGNLDATVLLEEPKLSPYIPEMQRLIAEILETEVSRISIKATRGEKLGFIGEGKGVKAYCSALIIKG